ncbi:MAG: histidine kinase [Chitinophagaceae bacterium]|nr:histidine kinase [Chitinophagaceae bacterium]
MNSLFSERKFLIYFQLWWLLVMLLHFWILKELDFDYYHAITDAVASSLILGSLSFLFSNNMRFYVPQKERYIYVLAATLLLCVLWLAFLWVVLYLIFPAGDNYIDFLRDSFGIRMGAGFLLTSSQIMFSLMLYSDKEQKEMEDRKSEADALNREAELFKLRQQLQPHFLFNSLNSVSSLIITNPDKARTMIQQLSDFLRDTLRKGEETLYPLSEELRHLELYLEIEKVRFGHRLQTVIDCDEALKDYRIPPLLLQPVVENAIKFGLYDTTGEVTIELRVERRERELGLIVSNPFDPETVNPAKGTGFGLASVRRRLFLLYSRSDLVSTHTKGGVFVTKILIPN